MLAAKAHQPLPRNAQLVAQRAQVFLDQIGRKAIVPGGHRRVGGEDHFPGDLVGSGVEVQAFFLHAVTHRLQHREPAVPLVEVKDAWSNAHGLQCAKAADAQEQLLPNTRAGVSAVQARAQFEVFRSIARHLGVE